MPIVVDIARLDPCDRRAAGLRWGLVLAYVLAFGGWLLVADGRFTHATNLLLLTGPLVAIALAAPAVLKGPRDRPRRAALFLLAAPISFTIGQVVWAWYENVLGRPVPQPSAMDACNLVAYACLLAGVLNLPWRAAAAADRGRAVLDAVTSTIAAASFSWYFVISPTLATAHGSMLVRSLAIAYPLLDLTVLCLNLILAGGGRRRGVPAAALVALVLPGPIVTAASVYYFVQVANGTYATGGLVDVTWPTACMLLAVAAWHLCRPGPRDRDADRPAAADEGQASPRDAFHAPRADRFATFLPYALLPPTVALAIYASRTDFWSYGAVGARTAAIAVVGLVLARQVLALIENERLYERLRRAFAELEASHDAAHGVNDDLAIANAQLAEANEKLKSLATTDGMTGLANHRTFQERLREEIARSGRTGESFAVLLIDVDHFKRLNDSYGHPAGDEVLKQVARLLRANVRAADLAARYGGEEFAVLCPNATAAGATESAERIRAAIAAHAFSLGGPSASAAARVAVTVSIGASATDIAGLDAGGLIRSADEALYRSKHEGRNRVTAATHTTPCGQEA